MKEKTADIDILEEKIEKDYKDMMAVINSTSLPLFVEDTIEDMYILIKTLIAENKELKEKNKKIKQEYINPNKARISYFDHKKRTNVVIEGFIPKSKVKELIEETKNEKLNYSEDEWYLEDEIKGYSIEKLQSLLGKE